MIATTIAVLMVACALVDCANSRQNDLLHDLPSLSEDANQAVIKRQSTCPIGGSISTEPSECLRKFATNVAAGSDTFDSAFCSDCGQVLYNYYVACKLNASTTTGNLEFYCSTNEDGNRCSSVLDDTKAASVYQSCVGTITNNMCTSECENALQTSTEDTRCCIYSLVAIRYTTVFANDIWNTCNRSTPAACEYSLGSGAVPVSVSALSFAVALLFAAALL